MKKIYRFTASWCQPCKALSKNLELANLDIPIEVIDIDVFEYIAIEYAIRSVPTLILKGGETEKRLVGVHSPEQIREWVNG
jgi:thioredoxin-like negative regulator of GroEL